MGLGKTLQTICILASDHTTKKRKYQETQSPEFDILPSLVVCPSTLITHWYHEILKFSDNLRPIMYTGTSVQREL